MPILPLDHPEPFAATLGVMLYPGKDAADQGRARAFTAQFLAEPLRRFHEAGGKLTYEELARISEDAGVPLDDLEDRWWGGTTTGEIFKIYFALMNTDRELASWSNATKVAQLLAVEHKVTASRSSLYETRRPFISVAHLWAAWCIRDRQWNADPDVGYDGWSDFSFFLAEAEILRNWGQTWKSKRHKATSPLPAEVWRVPDEWEPPDRQPEWPPTGRVPAITLERELLDRAGVRRSGRPKKSS